VTVTGDSVLALPARSGRNVIVLSATEPKPDASDFLRDAYQKRADVVRLFPGATQVWVDGGHDIPLEHPDAVIDAIRSVQRGTPKRDGVGIGEDQVR
jgi:hypothetical protein